MDSEATEAEIEENIHDWCSDCHYETETSFVIAELLVKAVNEDDAG